MNLFCEVYSPCSMKLLMLLLRSAPLFSLLLTFGLYKPLTEAVFKPQKPVLSFKSFPTDGFGLVFTNTVQEFLFFLFIQRLAVWQFLL